MMTEGPPVTRAMVSGARRGSDMVGLMLDGAAPPPVTDHEQAMAAANFLGYLMFTVQLANGLHPRSSVDFAIGDDRGSELARGFLTAGTVEICCDYCGQLMTEALAGAAAAQMRAVHGLAAAAQWRNLTLALDPAETPYSEIPF